MAVLLKQVVGDASHMPELHGHVATGGVHRMAQQTMDVSADLLELEGHGLTPGCEGSLLLVEGENRAQVLVDRPARALVVKAGRIVAEAGRYTGPGAP